MSFRISATKSIIRTSRNLRPYTNLRNMSTQQNEYGQGVSHATGGAGQSKVPESVQKVAPVGLEKGLPDSVHPTGENPGQSTRQTHAKDGGDASIVPKKLQEILPESVERAVPNAIHDTGDQGGLHRKQ